jgi:hypothetical protein
LERFNAVAEQTGMRLRCRRGVVLALDLLERIGRSRGRLTYPQERALGVNDPTADDWVTDSVAS